MKDATHDSLQNVSNLNYENTNPTSVSLVRASVGSPIRNDSHFEGPITLRRLFRSESQQGLAAHSHFVFGRPARRQDHCRGSFTQIGGQARTNIARLYPDGTVETNFHPTVIGGFPAAEVKCLAVQTNGQILVGGNFSALGGQIRKNIGRLNADGTVDATFNPGADGGPVKVLSVEPDGKILLSGSFFTVGGMSRRFVAQLNSDGTVDTNFNARANGSVLYLVPQADGKILLGGSFTQIGGQSRTNNARLNPDGTLDFSFNPALSGTFYPRAIQPDGKILVDGSFTCSGGSTTYSLARLNQDGSVDLCGGSGGSGGSGSCGSIASVALQTDGKILLAGGFTNLWGQPNGYLARLNADGTVDTNFTAGADSFVRALAVQSDGKILVGGDFSVLAGRSRAHLGRLSDTNTLAAQSLRFDNSTLSWTRGGNGPEILSAAFDYSPDGSFRLPLGSGVWASPQSPGDYGKWAPSGIAQPQNAILRAQGYRTGGDYNGSNWFVEIGGHPLVRP